MDALVLAEVDAEANAIAITTDGFGVEGLSVLLSPELIDLEKEVSITVDGEEVYKEIPTTSWAVFVQSALSCDPGRRFEARVELPR